MVHKESLCSFILKSYKDVYYVRFELIELKFTVKSIGIYRSVYKGCIHTHSCMHSVYEIMLHICALKFFLCFSYVKCHNFPLFSMAKA